MRTLILCLAAAALVVPAAGAPNAGEPAARGSIAPATYVFVPGDVIDVTVSSHTGFDRTITIQPDGRIQFPVAGELVAAGLTSTELAARLQEGLNRQLIDPQVTVTLKELNRGLLRRASVFGAVKTPGAYELKERSTLAEILATAGGPTPIADLSRIRITHTEGGQQVVNLAHVARTGELGDNVLLQPGDLILVPEGAPSTVLVLGQVIKPGSYDLQGEMRLMDALSQAGGPTPKADLRRVTLTRAGRTDGATIDLEILFTQGQKADDRANVLLQPGDTVVLPESERKFYVLGEVTKADAYPLKANDHLLDGLTTAGGSTREADLSKVMLIRKDEKGQPVARRVDLKQMMEKGDMARNEVLQVGDVIFVPNRKQKKSIGESLGFLYPLTGLLSIFR